MKGRETLRYEPVNPYELAYLHALLLYEPDTGWFRWKLNNRGYAGRAKAGQVAGTPKDGYLAITVRGRQWRAHVLAWLFMTGELPPNGKEIDHKDRDRANNKWSNLRLVTRSGNNHNAAPASSNKSGVRGVSWSSDRNLWDARIMFEGKVITLGRYALFEDAVAARRMAEQEMLGAPVNSILEKPLYNPRRSWPKLKTEAEIRETRRGKSLTTRITNTTGHRGVRLHKQSGKWHARIVADYKEISLGYYVNFEEAVQARLEAEKAIFEGV